MIIFSFLVSTFTVMSYNILADSNVQANYDLYEGPLEKYVKWSIRAPRLLQEIDRKYL